VAGGRWVIFALALDVIVLVGVDHVENKLPNQSNLKVIHSDLNPSMRTALTRENRVGAAGLEPTTSAV
jgi:hypothetical protein